MPFLRKGLAALLTGAVGLVVCPLSPCTAAGPDIETYIQIGYAGQPAMSADGRVVLFTTNTSGVRQLYRLTGEGWPYQLTVFPDGIDFYKLTPDGARAVVGTSRGGDEQSQLYLVDSTTGALTVLTSSPEVQYGSPVWSPDGTTLFFRSNEVNGRDFHLYARDLATGAVRRLYDGEGQNVIEDVSPDGRRLAVVHYASNSNSDLYVLEIASGRMTHLTPHEGDFLYSAPRFAAEGGDDLPRHESERRRRPAGGLDRLAAGRAGARSAPRLHLSRRRGALGSGRCSHLARPPVSRMERERGWV